MRLAGDTAKTSRATLTAAARSLRLVSFLMDALGTVRDANTAFSFIGSADDQKAIGIALASRS